MRHKFQHRNDFRHHSRSSRKGQLIARLEGNYDQRITLRLIFQPRLELNLSAQNMPAQRLGAGLTDDELGLRLRYDVSWRWKGKIKPITLDLMEQIPLCAVLSLAFVPGSEGS
jgi:hypothetical protein